MAVYHAVMPLKSIELRTSELIGAIIVRVRSSHQPFGTVTLQLYIRIPLNSVSAILIIAATQFFNRILARAFFKRLYAHPSNTCTRFRYC